MSSKSKPIEVCDTCKKPIYEHDEYTEIEETHWLGDSTGKAVTHYWHDKCGGEITN